MTQETVITRWTCEHITLADMYFIWIVPDGSPADWAFALQVLAKRLDLQTPGAYTYPDHLKALALCLECYRRLPSQRIVPIRVAAAPEEQTEKEEYKERVEAGEAVYWCTECSEFREEENLVQVRECPHCNETFNGSEEGRNCPSCNRPFSRLVLEGGCAECLSDSAPELLTRENWANLMGEENEKS